MRGSIRKVMDVDSCPSLREREAASKDGSS